MDKITDINLKRQEKEKDLEEAIRKILMINPMECLKTDTIFECVKKITTLDHLKNVLKRMNMARQLNMYPVYDSTYWGIAHPTLIQTNLMTQPGYSPYCGSVSTFCNNPRTVFNGSQFVCPKCGYTTNFDSLFIAEYKKVWDK